MTSSEVGNSCSFSFSHVEEAELVDVKAQNAKFNATVSDLTAALTRSEEASTAYRAQQRVCGLNLDVTSLFSQAIDAAQDVRIWGMESANVSQAIQLTLLAVWDFKLADVPLSRAGE